MGSIDSSLSALNSTLSDLATQFQQHDAAQVQTFTAYVAGTQNEKIGDARYIEDLRPNQNRLNVFTTMASGDNVDYYKFNLMSSGSVNFSILANQLDDSGNDMQTDTSNALDIQVMQMRGNQPVVIADSDSASGDNFTNFQALQADGLDMKAGKYVVKISRDSSAPDLANYFYSFQLSAGRYSQDFDTVETAASKSQGESILNYLQIDPAVGLMAGSVDSTSALAGQAATPVNGASLTAGQDNTTDPAVRLLDMFA